MNSYLFYCDDHDVRTKGVLFYKRMPFVWCAELGINMERIEVEDNEVY